MFCGQSFVPERWPTQGTFNIGDWLLLLFYLSSAASCPVPRSPPSLAYVQNGNSVFLLPFFLATATVLVVLHPAMPKASTSSKPKTQSSKPRKAAAPPSYHVRFANVSNDEAAQGSKKVSQRENTTIPARSSASDIQLRELWTRRLLCAHCCSTGKCKRKRKADRHPSPTVA
ncbi:hypothetical protein R3P38DRAFT_3220601 [Favolaschia claudopus]|uniref:Uncharacterized protein n=1 Tax=Favolaschia claudopus TaxID=2862362 RepID=A0AAW0A201_9AGAR